MVEILNGPLAKHERGELQPHHEQGKHLYGPPKFNGMICLQIPSRKLNIGGRGGPIANIVISRGD